MKLFGIILKQLHYYKSELGKYGLKNFLFTRAFYLKGKIYKRARRWYRVNIDKTWEISDKKLLSIWDGKCKNTASLLASWEDDIEESFFISTKDRNAYSSFINKKFPENAKEAAAQANEVMENTFDILGSGKIKLKEPIPWDTDFKTNHRYTGYSQDVKYLNMDQDDPKVPWELSRFSFALVLGKAYWYTNDEKYAEKYVNLLLSWLESNPYDWGVNWICPMEVAIRPVNMIWGYFFFSSSPHFSNELKVRFIKTLIQHAHFILWNLEGNPYGNYNNHYYTNGFGLLCLGIFLRKISKKWLKAGLKIITLETEKQLSKDGVHYEQSLGYHRLILDILMSSSILCKKNKIELPDSINSAIEKMLNFTLNCTRSDGSVPMVGDCDDGRLMGLTPDMSIHDHRASLAVGSVITQQEKFNIGGSIEEAFWLTGGPKSSIYLRNLKKSALPQQSKAYSDAGYYIMRSKSTHVIADCGPYGYHGHNDILGFELYAFDTAMIIDPGTYAYSSSYKWNKYFKSTYSHNVLGIDGSESTPFKKGEFWGIDKKNTYKVSTWESKSEHDLLSAEHYNYSHIKEGLTHKRSMRLSKDDDIFVIEDEVFGGNIHTVIQIFNLAPSFDVEVINNRRVVFKNTQNRGALILPLLSKEQSGLKIKIRKSWVSHKFGQKVESRKVFIIIKAKLPVKLCTSIMPFDSEEGMNTLLKSKINHLALHHDKQD